MKFVNTPEGGIISDIDVSKVKPNQLVFPTVGIRVFNKDGKGLIATLLPGNEELCDLSVGFMMMGGVEYEGIGFIFSYNVETGEGEVGTYPSPNLSSEGFKNVYTPLQNFKPFTNPTDLRTTLFNFNIHFQLDIRAKKSYDNSIDLYFIDFYNPDRVINNGFKLDGTTNNRYILPDNFSGALNHIPFTNKELKVNSADVTPGGYFKPGNVFVYIRYLTANYAPTNFIKEIGPLSMAPGDTQLTHVGLLEKDFSTDIDSQTDRKITLNLTNIDTNFAYIQVGIVRYSATTENGPAQQDVWLIANYYPITSASTIFAIYGDEEQENLAYADIIKEPFLYPISKTQTQIENRLLRANVKRSSLGYSRDALIHFASVIQVDEFYYDGDFATKTVQDYVQNGGLYSYQNANNVYKYLGYFKEQIYPFACIFKFTDGTLSESFPVLGNLGQTTEKGLYQFKTWQQACGVTPDQNRITGVSFDADEAHNYYRNNEDFFKDVVGFYFARADRIDNFICQGAMMRGYYGVRIQAHYGNDPDPNIRFCSFRGEIASDPVHSGANTTKENNADAAIMPLFRGYMPTSHEGNGTKFHYGYADDNNSGGTNCLEYAESGYDGCYDNTDKFLTLPPRFYFDANHWSQFEASPNAWDNKHGLFSPDLLFDNGEIQVNDNSYVRPLFTFGSSNGDGTFGLQPYIQQATRLIKPADICLDLNQSNGMGYMTFEEDPSQFIQVRSARVSHLQGKGKLNFAGYFASDGAETGFDWLSNIWNRDIGTCGYIGIEDPSIYKTLQKLYAKFITNFNPVPGNQDPYDPCVEHISIVNLYKNEITVAWQKGINDAFNVSSVQYSPISEMIAFGDLESSTTFNLFKGDCFLQKVWFRTHRWYAMVHNNDSGADSHGNKNAFGMAYLDPCGNFYQHGFMVGMTVECRYNSGMRSESMGANTDDKYLKYTFFPKALQNGIDLDQWIVTEANNYLQEATEINAGYDKVLGDKTIKGYDFTQPVFEYNKPNRVYASDACTPGAFLDGYRSIQQNSYQDFAVEDGDIMYIGKNLTFPFIVQRYGTNQIFINEKSMGQTDQGQDVIMGTSLTFFSDRVRKIGFMGTQHKSSVIDGTKGTYGFDYYNNIWWLINTAQLQTGLQQLKMGDLSGQLLITDELDKMFSIFSPDRIKSDELPDDPLTGLGIVGFADFDHEEVGMTFLLPISTDNGWKPGGIASRTFVFNERIEKFYGDYPFKEHIYFKIGNILLSNHSYLDDAYNYVTGNKMYRYNVKSLAGGEPNYATYFGNLEDTQISFIVNGASEKENTSELVKIFNALEVEMKDVKPKYIIFTTLYQSGTSDFSTTDFWKLSEYLEHKWHIPIILQSSAEEDAFQPTSEFRGAWLKVTMVFHTNEDIELKSVITDFELSYA